jgi:hypothetical protein
MKIAFFSATRNTIEETLFYHSINRIVDRVKTEHEASIHFVQNNTEGLSLCYNKFLDKHRNKFDYVVFVHDDVYIDDYNVVDKITKAHTNFDIVGIAGGVNAKVIKPALWHLMCGGIGSGNLRGAVAHFTNNEQIIMTTFGPIPSRVAVLDGLFISVNVKKAKSVGWKFNENYTFHHYDIASSIDANNKKLKLGVFPIWVTHRSPGLLDLNDPRFTTSQDKFVSEYSRMSV